MNIQLKHLKIYSELDEADGVLMEAYFVDDSGDGVCFCVYVYNVQPDIDIDYATGDSKKVKQTYKGLEENTSEYPKWNKTNQRNIQH